MSVEWKSAEEHLREQFYRWELHGRGWEVWSDPVHLEPPFRPFPGHFLAPQPFFDDGRRHTTLSRVAAWFKGETQPPPTAVSVIEDEEDFPIPTLIEETHPLRSFVLHVPREQVVRPDGMAAYLGAIRGARYPIAFELVGCGKEIAVQLAIRAPDERMVIGALRNYFPNVTVVPRDLITEWLDRVADDTSVAVFEISLRREFMLPLTTFRSFDPDPFLAHVAALEEMEDQEMGAVQVLFEPAHEPWAESIFRAVTNSDGSDFFVDAPEITKGGKQKALQPLYAATMRVAVGGYDEKSAQSRLLQFGTALAQFESIPGNQLFLLQDEVDFDRRLDFLRRESHRSGMLLTLDELTGLAHLPSVSVQSKAIIGRVGFHSHAAAKTETQGILLGVNRHAGREIPVYLSRDRSRRHVHIVGASGSGKSNLLLQILLEDIRQGGGVALLDPHGDLVDDLLARIPEERLRVVIVFDPADSDYPVGFNVLAAHSDLERTLLASDLVAIFRRLSTSWGDQMHAILANAIQAFLESTRGGTIADLRRFLIDPEFRTEFLTTIPDPEMAYYWKKEFPLLQGRPQGPILTRIDAFLRPKLVRQMVTQKEMKIDFRRVMDDGKIFLAKLAQGAIGEENAALLGSFLFAKFHQTAMSRQDVRASERRPFMVAADECQHFVTPSMASILAGARKYSMGLLLVHQDLVQLQRRDAEVYASVLANAGTRIVFRVSDADSRVLSDGFAHFEAEDLRALSAGEAICRFDRADHDFNLAVPLIEPIDEDEAANRRALVIATSRATYAGPRLESKPLPTQESPDDAEEDAPVEEADAEPTSAPLPAAPTVKRAARAPVSKPKQEMTLGRGGAQHKYLQELVKRFGEAAGYHATIEKAVLEGKGSVDVALESPDRKIGVEISITSTVEYETANVAKCLQAGFTEVVVLGENAARLKKLEAAIETSLTATQLPCVRYRIPEDFIAELASQPATGVAPGESVGGYRVKVSYGTGASAAADQKSLIAKTIAKAIKRSKE